MLVCGLESHLCGQALAEACSLWRPSFYPAELSKEWVFTAVPEQTLGFTSCTRLISGFMACFFPCVYLNPHPHPSVLSIKTEQWGSGLSPATGSLRWDPDTWHYSLTHLHTHVALSCSAVFPSPYCLYGLYCIQGTLWILPLILRWSGSNVNEDAKVFP